MTRPPLSRAAVAALATGGLLLAASCGETGLPAPADPRPNVLLVMVDQLASTRGYTPFAPGRSPLAISATTAPSTVVIRAPACVAVDPLPMPNKPITVLTMTENHEPVPAPTNGAMR